MKTALLAGGAGFIGSNLCDLLLSKDYNVIVVDSLVTGRKSNLTQALKSGRVEWVEADIRSRESLNSALRPALNRWGKLDEVYELASPASPVDFAKMPLFILETAALGLRNILDLAHEHQAPVLFASSSEVYGDAEVHPQVETYFGNVSTTGHRSCYDEAKRYGEALCVAHAREHGTSVRMARIFNTYGPRMRPNDGRIIPNFFMQALQKQALTIYGDGTQTRSFCYVADQAAGLFALLQSRETRPTNIGNPIERTVREIADHINRLTGNTQPHRHLPLPEHDPKMRKPNIDRATSSFGWRPLVGLEEGLEHCLTYFKAELAAAPTGAIDTPNV